MNVDLVRKTLAIFAKPPEVRIDEPTGAIMVGPFTLSEDAIEAKGLGGRTHKVKSYILDVHTGEGDITDLYSGTDFHFAVEELAAAYAKWQARSIQDDLAADALAADYREQQEQLQQAFNEGLEHFRTTPIKDRFIGNNPYPYGIAHHKEWRKGYHQGEADTVF